MIILSLFVLCFFEFAVYMTILKKFILFSFNINHFSNLILTWISNWLWFFFSFFFLPIERRHVLKRINGFAAGGSVCHVVYKDRETNCSGKYICKKKNPIPIDFALILMCISWVMLQHNYYSIIILKSVLVSMY